MEHSIGPHPLRHGQTLGDKIGGVDRSHTAQPSHLDGQQPNRAAPEHGRGVAGPQLGQVHRVNGHPQRFQHRPISEVHLFGQGEDQRGRMGNVLDQAAPCGRGAHKEDVRAQVGITLQTELAGSAGDGRLHGYPCSHRRAFNARPQGSDNPGEFVSQLVSFGDPVLPDAAVLVVVHIRTTDAYSTHPNEQITGLRFGTRYIFHAQVAWAIQTRSFHLSNPSKQCPC